MLSLTAKLAWLFSDNLIRGHFIGGHFIGHGASRWISRACLTEAFLAFLPHLLADHLFSLSDEVVDLVGINPQPRLDLLVTQAFKVLPGHGFLDVYPHLSSSCSCRGRC